MKRRVLSTIIALLLVAALLPMSVLAASYTDTYGHWAESSIERWSDAGVVQGTGDAFAPDSDLTCAQLATILAKLLKLPAAKDAGFSDNKADAWYYDAINRCAAAGILNGYADGTVRPNETISRARAMVMLARALGIETAGTSVLNGYADAANVPDWARGYVAALLRAGIVSGVSGSRLAALANITRAQFVTILDRAIAIYADEDGATVKADDVDGIIVVVAEDVQIKDAPAGTKVVAAASAKSLKVNGKSVDANDIHIVPETVERPKSVGHAHSHEYKYTDNGDGTHTGVCTANDSTLEPAEHEFDENRKCTICGAVQPTTAVASVLGEDGTYTYCDTLAAALAAVADGGTVKLVANITNPGHLTVTNKKVTLDMSGHTITSNDKQVFNVSGTGDLTITGNGTIAGPTGETAKSFDSYSVIYITGEKAKLTVLDGTITAGGVEDCGMYGIYVADGGNVILGDADAKTGPSITTWFAAVGENNTTSPANITIYGGEYTAQAAPAASDWWTYFCAPIYASASGDINIYGGTFNGYYGISSRYANVGQDLNIFGGIFNGSNAALFVDTKTGTACDKTRTIAITGGTFSSNPSAYVADGYFALPNGDGTYTVVTADQITSGVTIQGIAGYEHSAFATVADAYSEINPKVAALGGLGQETCSKEAFDALYTDDAKITWTIYGKQALVAGSEGKDAHTFTFGRAASYYRNDCNIAAIIVKGGNDSAALDLSATGGTFALPYNWWGEKIKNCEVSFTGITFDGIKSIPSTWASQAQSTPYTFDRCTFNGSVYGYHDYNINLTIQNSTFNAPENTDYAVMLQSETGINGTVTLDHNTFNGYTRGVNLQRPGTDFIFTNNTITSTVSKPDRAAIQLTDGKSFTVTGNTVRVNAGNAFWFHEAAKNSDVEYTISGNDIHAPYIGYYATSFDVNPKITSSGNIFNSTDINQCMRKEATEATPTNLTAIQ